MTVLGTDGWVDAEGAVEVVNETGLADDDIRRNPSVRELARALTKWRNDSLTDSSARRGRTGLFSPGKYTSSDNPYDQMRTARRAADDDDIISTALEVTEGLTFQHVRASSPDADVADVFDQLFGDVDLDSYVRTMWREMEMYGQSVTASRWGYREYTSRKLTPSKNQKADGGQKRYPKRKPMRLWVPTQIVTMDPLKIVPVGMAMFGEERLAWHAGEDDMDVWHGRVREDLDPAVEQLVRGAYRPSKEEAVELAELKINPEALLELDPQNVWRHTVGKASYERFASVRFKSLFRLLDMKQQLLASDRVALVANANYILLVRQGDKETPGTAGEVQHLKENFKVLASLPVIVADHRLNIDIITPSLDKTLDSGRYDMLDRRILTRLIGSLTSGASASRTEGSAQSSSRVMSRALESRRLLARRIIERKIISAVWNHPLNAPALAAFKDIDRPRLAFTPRNIQVDADALTLQILQAARQSNEISRQTFLEHLNLDMEEEGQRLEYEKTMYPEWEQAVPFNGGGDANGESPAVSGARGGRPAGGGSSTNNSKVAPRTATGNKST